MTTRFLKVENAIKFNPDIEILCSLGTSLSRGLVEKIGQFGSGFVYLVALLARKGLLHLCKLCLGTDVYTFEIKSKLLKDANGNEYIQRRIYCKKQGGGSMDMNIDVQFGAIDWTDTGMALREIISNGLDGANDYDGTYDTFNIEIVKQEGERDCRCAKKGFIRFYVPCEVDGEVEAYFNNLHNHFLCLYSSYRKDVKLYRNNGRESATRVYRKGVLVGEMSPGLFHYNINDISLNESRIVRESEARQKCAEALAFSAENSIKLYLENMIDPNSYVWEKNFDSYFLNPRNNWSKSQEERDIAQALWDKVVGEVFKDKVLCENGLVETICQSKGLSTIRAEGTLLSILKRSKVKKSRDVLDSHELEGREFCPCNENVHRVLDKVWNMIEMVEMTFGKDKPDIRLFRQNSIEGGMLGYYCLNERATWIAVREDIKDDNGDLLYQTILEECSHYVSGAGDYTRDFQEYAFKLATKLARVF